MPNAAATAPARYGPVALVALVVLGFGAVGTATALETDQFFAWGRHLEDMTAVLNARVNLELERLVAELNREGRDRPCQKVRSRFFKRHRMLFFDGFETWSVNSPLVSRSPAGPEEIREFEQKYIYAGTSSLFDTGRWMPPSPTVEVNGVRLGTDKLTHVLGTAWYYHRWYRKARSRGATAAEAERRALRLGLGHEITILGKAVSGVLSLADLEANYEGMWFYEHLCAGNDPTIVYEDGDVAPSAAVRPARLRDSRMGRVLPAEHLHAAKVAEGEGSDAEILSDARASAGEGEARGLCRGGPGDGYGGVDRRDGYRGKAARPVRVHD